MNFNEKTYVVLKQVPEGSVTTYKEIARALKSKAYRAVGNAMNKNPNAPEVPCHRVVRSDGSIGGFASGTQNKIKMLRKEGVPVVAGKIDLKKHMHKFG